ncbi:hypothetical protein ACHMW6_05375 [Pseudoduganella sp. UC29_106]|uniref:hypothetical protein n=1 Tax=Pseudoduganella sp. UC29_106 TaxID=3374553 RepID=UPI0037573413
MTDWHIVNILLPLALPILLIAILGCAAFTRANWRTILLMPVRDGQLSWAGLGYCLNGLYEMRHSRAEVLTGPSGDWLFWTLNLVLILLAVTAAVAPLSARHHGQRNSRGTSIVIRYALMLLSLFFCCVAAAMLTVVHHFA